MSIILTDENFENEIKKSNKPVLVDFFATWCEPCSVLAPILEKVAEEFKDKVILLSKNEFYFRCFSEKIIFQIDINF